MVPRAIHCGRESRRPAHSSSLPLPTWLCGSIVLPRAVPAARSDHDRETGIGSPAHLRSLPTMWLNCSGLAKHWPCFQPCTGLRDLMADRPRRGCTFAFLTLQRSSTFALVRPSRPVRDVGAAHRWPAHRPAERRLTNSCPPKFRTFFGDPVFPPFSNKTPPHHPIYIEGRVLSSRPGSLASEYPLHQVSARCPKMSHYVPLYFHSDMSVQQRMQHAMRHCMRPQCCMHLTIPRPLPLQTAVSRCDIG